MKRFLALCLTLVLSAGLLTGCREEGLLSEQEGTNDSNVMTIIKDGKALLN